MAERSRTKPVPTMKINYILIAAVVAAPFVYSSCSHPAAAGAATYAAVDQHQEQQKKEDYANAKKNQAERRADAR